MANFLTDAYRSSMVGRTAEYSARVDADTDVLKASFIDQGVDTPLTSHVFVSAISATALVPVFASSVTLASVTAGVLGVGVVDAADTTFLALSGASVEGIVVYKFVSLTSDSPVLAYWNTGFTGVPFTPTGGDVVVQWSASGLWQV